MVAKYLPTALFSLKTSQATSSVGRTLVVPTMYAIKMALVDAGFRAVIAPRVADIFRNNALRNGFVPVEVDADTVASLVAAVRLDPATTITIDVEHATVQAPGVRATFALDEFSRTRLIGGLDDIALTLRHEQDIAAYEEKRPEWLPRVR